MKTTREYYDNVQVNPKVGHQTHRGEITEIDVNGRVLIEGCNRSFFPDELTLSLLSEDIVEYQGMEHMDSGVIMAFMHGHIVKIGGEDYRFARKDQHLYQTEDMVFVAIESGIFKRYLSCSSDDLDTPTDFKWILAMEWSYLFSLIAKMTEEEKILTVGNLALDKSMRTER